MLHSFPSKKTTSASLVTVLARVFESGNEVSSILQVLERFPGGVIGRIALPVYQILDFAVVCPLVQDSLNFVFRILTRDLDWWWRSLHL